jgi:hypothetical protein
MRETTDRVSNIEQFKKRGTIMGQQRILRKMIGISNLILHGVVQKYVVWRGVR